MMFKQVVPISWERHRDKKVKRLASFAFAGEEIITPVVAAEFPRAAVNYPVVFLKDKEGRTGSVAQLGLAKGKNLFIDGEGRWRAAYIPTVSASPAMATETSNFLTLIPPAADMTAQLDDIPYPKSHSLGVA